MEMYANGAHNGWMQSTLSSTSVDGAAQQPNGVLHDAHGLDVDTWMMKDGAMPAQGTADYVNGDYLHASSSNDASGSTNVNVDYMNASTSGTTVTPTGQGFYGSFPGTFYPHQFFNANQWPQSPPTISKYSSLNGATSLPAATDDRPPPALQPTMIDPALTMTDSHMADLSPTSYLPPASLPQSPPPQHQPYSHSYTFNHYVHPDQTQHQHQQSPPQAPPQQPTTLAPAALHTGIDPATFYASTNQQYLHIPTGPTPTPTPPVPPAAPPISPEERKQQFLTSLRQSLQPTSFSGAGAVHELVVKVERYGPQDVDIETRLEMLGRISANAANHYFQAWTENDQALELLREWLKVGALGKDDGKWTDTIMPLLQVIDRLPFTLATLSKSKMGKVIVKLIKDAPTPAIKDMASNLERKWRQLIDANGSKKVAVKVEEDPKTKKRKLSSDVISSSAKAPPSKKPAMSGAFSATAASGSKVPMKKETKVVVTTVKAESKTDSSFFSAPKAKPKLPSFKKAHVASSSAPSSSSSSSTGGAAGAMKKEDGTTAQPSSFNPFEDVLKSLRPRTQSPAVANTPSPGGANAQTASGLASSGLTKKGKRKRNVAWAADDKLEQIRWIEKAIYDDDPEGGMHGHSIRDLERDEGAALHSHLFEELVDWSEPVELVIIPPPSAHGQAAPPRGHNSQEKEVQEERERSELAAVYMSDEQIPESPVEPAQVLSLEAVDANVARMHISEDLKNILEEEQPAPPPASVAELMSQLSGTDVAMHDLGANPDPSALQLQALLQMIPGYQQQPLQQQPLQQQHSYYEEWSDPQFASNNYGGGYQNDADSNDYGAVGSGEGWAGRGRGRGGARGRGGRPANKGTSLCHFYQRGRCKFGNNCDFIHETPL